MKYLIQNPKEFAITVAAFVVAVINLIRAFRTGEINEDVIITVILTAVGVLAWYRNMPTSAENCRATGLMRLEKARKNAVETIGEDFFEDFDDEEEEDEEDYDKEEIEAAESEEEQPPLEDKFGDKEGEES